MMKKDDAIPVVQGETLIYQRSGRDERLPVGTPAWYAWLSTARSFAFRSALGTSTARKESTSNKRRGEYWRAYRKCEGRLHRVYLGKAEELTLDRLHPVAPTLAEHDTVDEDEPEPVQHALHPATAISQPPAGRPSTLPLPFTSLIGREREVEVLRLVARGLTDAQVAQILVFSPRTVNAHLRTIYSKPGITSRHAATFFALEHHLI